MIRVNSLSGGKTSAFIAANYPADYNVFSLVRTDDKNCMFPDAKIRQMVSDKIGKEFIGTLEDDMIIKTMFDLEQFIGTEINWVSGKTFDEIIINKGGSIYLPNPTQRFCTQEMKLKPIFEWWQSNINQPIEMRIGFRANETRRANNMIQKMNSDGLMEFKAIVGKMKDGRNKWSNIGWQKPSFPLINDNIFKDKIELYWEDMPVEFAYMNNCIGCFHRNPMLLKHMANKFPKKFDWFCKKEADADGSWRKEFKYEKIKNHETQLDLFDSDFGDCDSGYCGL